MSVEDVHEEVHDMANGRSIQGLRKCFDGHHRHFLKTNKMAYITLCELYVPTFPFHLDYLYKIGQKTQLMLSGIASL